MPRRVFPLRSLSAALVLSTSFTVPAYAVYINVTVPEGDLTGPITYADPIHIFHSSARLESTSFGFWFTDDLDEGYLLSGSSIKTTSGGAGFVVSGNVGTLSNAGTIESRFGDGFELVGDVRSFINTRTGIIQGGSEGVYIDGVTTSFTNDGSITGVVRGVSFDSNVGTFLNTGTISATGGGIYFDDNVGTFTNAGSITAGTGDAIYIDGDVDSIVNTGTLYSLGGDGVSVLGTTGSFFNSGEITGLASGGKNVDLDGGVTGTFENTGTIYGAYRAVDIDAAVGHFINSGTIKADTDFAIDAESNDFNSFVNSGTIESLDYSAMQMGAIGTFTNSGTIAGRGGYGVQINGAVTGSFVNTGAITGRDGGVSIDGSVASFINNGTISSRDGSFVGAVRIGQPITGTFINNGTIESNTGWGVGMRAGRLVNTGTIKGDVGINSDMVGMATTLVNSGTIQGTGGTAFYLGDETVDDTVELLTGSRVFGIMDFSHGNDTLDVAGFRGNAVLNVARLENVVTGSTLVSQQLDGDGTGTLSVIDATGITSGGTASLGEIAGAIGSEIAGALGGMTGSAPAPEPMGYAPARPVGAAEAATDELVATQPPTGPEVWGKVFGGVTGKANEYGAALGGIVAGSHVSVDASTRLGGVVSVSGSRFATVGNGQVVASTIGALGLYGSTDLGGPVLSYSVLGGVATNHSDRTVTAMVTETARADFASWFWSPELGISIPVPLLDGAETSAGFKLRYIGGGVGAYTETGSSQNLSVGSSSLNLLDARAELTSKAVVAGNDFGDVTLSATGGLLALHNFGSSVTIAGFPLATTPASFAYGVYGDVTLQGPIGPAATASASVGTELRSDGVATASANMGLSATF